MPAPACSVVQPLNNIPTVAAAVVRNAQRIDLCMDVYQLSRCCTSYTQRRPTTVYGRVHLHGTRQLCAVSYEYM